MNDKPAPTKDFSLNINLDEELKLRQRLDQPSEIALSDIIFNTGEKALDINLEKMFKALNVALQKKHMLNHGDGEIENLFVQILKATEDVDAKVLPPAAITCMFASGTELHLDHTLGKDTKLNEEELGMKSNMQFLDAALSQGVVTMPLADSITPDAPLDEEAMDNLIL